jgi:hypothetical protein
MNGAINHKGKVRRDCLGWSTPKGLGQIRVLELNNELIVRRLNDDIDKNTLWVTTKKCVPGKAADQPELTSNWINMRQAH